MNFLKWLFPTNSTLIHLKIENKKLNKTLTNENYLYDKNNINIQIDLCSKDI